MEKHKGTTRTVFVFKNIVIKVARINWKGVWHLFIYKLKHLNRKSSSDNNEDEEWRIEKEQKLKMKILVLKKYEIHGTIQIYFFSGIMANLQELRFYKKTRNLFVMPTCFSFFGLFNIQKRGEKIDFWEGKDVWHYIYHTSQNSDQPFCDGHTLSSVENFCIDNRKLKLVDYGNRQLGEFLKINGENLYNNFKHP